MVREKTETKAIFPTAEFLNGFMIWTVLRKCAKYLYDCLIVTGQKLYTVKRSASKFTVELDLRSCLPVKDYVWSPPGVPLYNKNAHFEFFV